MNILLILDFANHHDYLIDWNENVVTKINEREDIKEISEYVLHIARIVNYPDLCIKKYLKQIEELGEELKLKIDFKNMRPTYIIEKFNEFFYEEKGFLPNKNDYYNPNNNYLNIVLDKKVGIPITLSLIYIHLASYLNFELEPVNFPSHFLVKYTLDKESNEFIIIDPFNKGRIMDDQVLQGLLNKINPTLKVLITKNNLEKANTSKILIRILNNLKNAYMEVDDLNKIKIINEMILLLDKFNPDAIRDSGIMLYRGKKFKQALERFYEYVELNPEAIDIDKILDFIRQIRNMIKD